MILWLSFQPCQDLGPGGSERRAVGAQVMIITMLMFTVFMTLMVVVVEMTRGVRKESSWGPGDDNHNVDVQCLHDVDDGGGRDDQGGQKGEQLGPR